VVRKNFPGNSKSASRTSRAGASAGTGNKKRRKTVSAVPPAKKTKRGVSEKIEPATTPGELAVGKTSENDQNLPQVTLQASRRFWLMFLGSTLVILALVQGYGYFTGWGNPKRVIQRQFNTAQRLTLAKRYKAAIRQYKKIMNTVEDAEVKRQAAIAMADLYREQKEWSQAIKLYQDLQAKDSDTVMAAWTGLKIAESQHAAGKSAAALKTYQAIREKFPNSDWDAEARLGMGKVLMDLKKYKQAIALYRTLEVDYKGGFLAAEALVHIGECYTKQGDIETARKIFQSVLDKYPATMTDEAKRYLQRLDVKGKPEGVRVWGE